MRIAGGYGAREGPINEFTIKQCDITYNSPSMTTSHYDFGVVSVDVEDEDDYSIDQVMDNLSSVDEPAKVLAAAGANFFCGATSIRLTEHDLVWYNNPENKEAIENAFRNEVHGSAKITITWISEADEKPPMLQDGSAVWTITISGEEGDAEMEDSEQEDD